MSFVNNIVSFLPEVKGPDQKYLSFNQKLKWTSIILVSYFVMGVIPLYKLGQNELANFEFLSIILGAQFGSLISLGIGPIVTASIVLQLLNGSGILKLDTATHEGRVFFQGLQKVLSIFFKSLLQRRYSFFERELWPDCQERYVFFTWKS